MSRLPSTLVHRFAVILALIATLLVMAWAAGYLYLRASLPLLEGQLSVEGLSGDVRIERDRQGIPTLQAQHRQDIALGLGFLHAQERFFQMDLLRRRSSGELSELLGKATLSADRAVRVHQFRRRAERALQALSAEEQQFLGAYANGVNQGLQQLSRYPFEYGLLRQDPAPWRPEDTFLVLYSMYIDLQSELNGYERSLAVMRDQLPADWFQFLLPAGGYWDSPIDGDPYVFSAAIPEQPLATLLSSAVKPLSQSKPPEAWPEVGSNNWSISGRLTSSGAGMLANDMHLGLRVPNIWYRASWRLPGDERRVTGVSLPGVPVMVVGSNEHIAWGFTNAYGDFHDCILLQVNGAGDAYLTANGWEPFRLEQERIVVKGEQTETLTVRHTRWGPVIGSDHQHRLLALRWVAHDTEGANLGLMGFESANSVQEAIAQAAAVGIPHQNLNVVDRDGNQAWTIAGRLPRRYGFKEKQRSPSYPQDWSEGDLNWQGYLRADEYPVVMNPDEGRLWTANARVASGKYLAAIGRDRYALGARQQQIHRRLMEQTGVSESSMLAIALDDRADFLQRWHGLLTGLLTTASDQAFAGHSTAQLLELLQQWQGRAAPESVGYLLVKRFREQVIAESTGAILQSLDQQHEFFEPRRVDSYLEYATWELINQQPEQHIPPGASSWDDFMRRCLQQVLTTLTADGRRLNDATWGSANTLAIDHPLVKAVPWLSRWLSMPAEPMPGDTFMPRVQRPAMGASQRLVVSPGFEQQGIFHMATGQSGHPLSPYFTAGHRDWVEGRASRFLPADTQWQLTLQPSP